MTIDQLINNYKCNKYKEISLLSLIDRINEVVLSSLKVKTLIAASIEYGNDDIVTNVLNKLKEYNNLNEENVVVGISTACRKGIHSHHHHHHHHRYHHHY